MAVNVWVPLMPLPLTPSVRVPLFTVGCVALIVTAPVPPVGLMVMFVPATIEPTPVIEPVNPLNDCTPIFVIVTAPVAPDTEIPVPATAADTPCTDPVLPLNAVTVSATISFCTNAVVAICVVFVPRAAVGAAGVPVNVGDASSAHDAAAVLPSEDALDAVPVSAAVMVPAEKFPLASRNTIVEPVFAFVALDVTVKVAALDWFAVKVCVPDIPLPLVFMVSVPLFTVGCVALIVTAPVPPVGLIVTFVPATIEPTPATAPVNPLKDCTPILVMVTVPVAPDTEIPVPATAAETP